MKENHSLFANSIVDGPVQIDELGGDGLDFLGKPAVTAVSMAPTARLGLTVSIKEGPVRRHPELAPHDVLGPDRQTKLFCAGRLEAT